MPIYTYSRVSTRMQADDGESLGVQQRMCAGYALMHGLKVSESFVERGVSGTMPFAKRPEGKRLLSLLKAGDTVVAAKLDRMFRNAADALNTLKTLKDMNVSLHLIDIGGDVTTNGISKLVFTILSAVAEQERDRICERIQDTKTDQAERGRFLGGKVPFGYRVERTADKPGGELVEIPEEQAVIAQARELRAVGKTLREIQSALSVRLSLDAIARITR